MLPSSSSSNSWIYNPAKDASKYFKLDKNVIKNKCYKVEIQEDDKGVNYLSTDQNNTERKVHIFIAKGFFTNIKYFFLKNFTKNWTEVKLCREGDKSKKIRVLIDNQNLISNEYKTQDIMSVFDCALRPKLKDSKQIEFQYKYPVQAQRELIFEKSKSSPWIEKLFLKNMEFKFGEQDEFEFLAKIELLSNLFDKLFPIKIPSNDSVSDNDIKTDPDDDKFLDQFVNNFQQFNLHYDKYLGQNKDNELDIKKDILSEICKYYIDVFDKKYEKIRNEKIGAINNQHDTLSINEDQRSHDRVQINKEINDVIIEKFANLKSKLTKCNTIVEGGYNMALWSHLDIILKPENSKVYSVD